MQRGIFESKKTLVRVSEVRVEILNMEIRKKFKDILCDHFYENRTYLQGT